MSHRVWLGWIVVLGLVGCNHDDPVPTVERCSPATCYADPVAHWVCEEACRTDAECPGGFVCVRPELEEGEADEERQGRCEPPRMPRAPTGALLEGFGVDEMTARLEGLDFSWTAPAVATVVHCALFVCAPVIEAVRIVNYDQCVIAEQTYAQPEGAFSLYDVDVQSPVPLTGFCGDRVAPKLDTAGRFAVTELLVGCWAYDQRDLVAATTLERPEPSGLFDFHGALAQEHCALETDLERSCQLDDGTFGVCRPDGCARRCLRDEDCAAAGDGTPVACEPLFTSLGYGACPVEEPPEQDSSTGTSGPDATTTQGG